MSCYSMTSAFRDSAAKYIEYYPCIFGYHFIEHAYHTKYGHHCKDVDISSARLSNDVLAFSFSFSFFTAKLQFVNNIEQQRREVRSRSKLPKKKRVLPVLRLIETNVRWESVKGTRYHMMGYDRMGMRRECARCLTPIPDSWRKVSAIILMI